MATGPDLQRACGDATAQQKYLVYNIDSLRHLHRPNGVGTAGMNRSLVNTPRLYGYSFRCRATYHAVQLFIHSGITFYSLLKPSISYDLYLCCNCGVENLREIR